MITQEDILNLLKEPESFRIEKTMSVSNTDKFCEAICAFANDMPDSRKNGYLLIGVNDDGSLSGLKATDIIQKNISDIRTAGNILPQPNMSVQPIHFDDGDVLVVEVIPSYEPPVRYKGRAYIRIGPRKGIATPEEENILTEKRQYYVRSFDVSPCRDATLEDIDQSLFLNSYLPRAVSPEVLQNDSRDIKDKMASLRLYDKTRDCPTNAALLLFGKNVDYFFPGAYVQFVQFAGVDNAAEITNQNEFRGNLMSSLPVLKTFVETSVIKKWPVPVSALQEKIKYNYPEWAIRELLMNAIMHRDYSGNTPVKFYIYADRLEITNPGGLYGNARPENFPDVNDYRNPVISEALKILGYVNKYNRGVARVKQELWENGNGEAAFTLDKITVFAVSVYDNKAKSFIPSKGITSPALMDRISKRGADILRFCLVKERTRQEIFDHLGISSQTTNVRAHLYPLIDAGLIEYKKKEVTSRGQRYLITEKGKQYLNSLEAEQ